MREVSPEGAAATRRADSSSSTAGRSVQRDYAEAREWYEKAVAQGHAKAKAYLAELLEHGRGGPKDLPRAMKLYEEAAAQGVEAARKALARLKG